MNVEQILSSPTLIDRLNTKIQKHTNFTDYQDLVDVKHNYRPTLYLDDSMPNIERQELIEVADFYDAYMELHDDPRRVYRG